MAVDETPSTGPCGLHDPVLFGVGDTVSVSAENDRARGSRIPEEGPSRRAGISTRLVSRGDWTGPRPCSSAHGDFAGVRAFKGGGNLEKPTKPAAEKKFQQRLSRVYWDSGGIWVRGFSPPRWVSTKRLFGSMCGTKASRRRDKRSLNFVIPPPVKAGESLRLSIAF